MKRIIVIVLILTVVLGFLFWKYSPLFLNRTKEEKSITLTYFGFSDDEDLLKPVIDSFEKQNPKITINFVGQSKVNYRTRVQTQIRAGVGPDIFRIHNSWLSMFEMDIIPSPPDVFTLTDYSNLFYPISVTSFVKASRIYAAPLMIDGLALFINKDMLDGIGGAPPKNWREFIELVKKMTVRDSNGIKTAGAALGSASNVDFWSDIIGLLLLQQPNVNLENLATADAAEVLSFYIGFITDPTKKTWDLNLPNSTQMFADGRLGFYFAPYKKIYDLKIANPNLKFEIAPVPQLSTSKTVNWASFWGETVSKNSSHPKESWQFIKFLTSAESERLIFQEGAKQKFIGPPYSLVSLSAEISQDPLVGAFVTQAPNYKSWYLSSETQDVGVNDEIIKYFSDGINATLQGADPVGALQVIQKEVQQVLDKYIRPAPTPSP